MGQDNNREARKLSDARKRCLNMIAENALRRGRKLTPAEKLENLEREFGFEPGYFRNLRNIKD